MNNYQQDTRTNYSAMLSLVIGSIVFGLGSLIVAYVSVGAYAMTVWRLGIASVVFFGLWVVHNWFFKQKIVFPKNKKAHFFMVLAGVFLGLDLSLWHESIYAVGPGISTLLNSLQIFFLAVIGLVFFKERLSTGQMLSLLLAIFGVSLIASPEFNNNIHAKWGFFTGILSGMMLAISMACIRQVHEIEKTHIIPLMFVLSIFGAISILPLAIMNGDGFLPKNSQEWMLIVIYGVVMQCFAWGLIAFSIPKLTMAITGLILLTEPVATIFIDYFYLKKNIGLVQWVGVVVTLFAIYLGSIKPKKSR